jgi:recombination protein RecR
MKEITSLERLIETLEELPTIGKKSATRLALFLAKDKFKALKLANAIEEVVTNIKECRICGNFSENEICEICNNENREKSIAIVETQKDIITIEKSGSYKGYYFVLPHIDNKYIKKLKDLIKNKKIEEIIFAFSPSVESEARSLYIQEQLKELNVKFSQIVQGIPTGVQFENVDIPSLAKAIKLRISFKR